MSTSTRRPQKARLNLKIDAQLKEWAQDYATRHGVDITKLLCSYLLALRKQEQVELEGVQQI